MVIQRGCAWVGGGGWMGEMVVCGWGAAPVAVTVIGRGLVRGDDGDDGG